jgi:hypothetical protein
MSVCTHFLRSCPSCSLCLSSVSLFSIVMSWCWHVHLQRMFVLLQSFVVMALLWCIA